ncbi:MAG: ComF family protein [Bacteroidetes bacterium]|mgnify:CR=1 FL=1|jgi:ComF family protein|nr:ComF family protein [Bacteroidota bacterium]MBT6685478.1 ComF family protein [Bacteroidota bacterium]MBT7143743.1 ComF family protein [Bacteroidota bacterium]MBT7491458.1 ComF family protein [Bacteroidota bacterium]
MKTILRLLNDLLFLIYPQVCEICGNVLSEHEDQICSKCLYELPKTNFHSVIDNPVNQLFWGKVKINSATSYFFFRKGSKFRTLIHKLKYSGKKEIGFELGKRFGGQLAKSEHFKDIDIIIPVPLHPEKLKERGYNQSNWLAKGISKTMNKMVDNSSLCRKKYTDTQTKKNRQERWENVKSAFEIIDVENLKNKHVLLIDDVITTGATLEACASKILEIENTKVSIATIAMAA